MILKIHQDYLTELQELLLAAAIYFDCENKLQEDEESKVVNEVDPAELMGAEFDRLYKYDNQNNK